MALPRLDFRALTRGSGGGPLLHSSDNQLYLALLLPPSSIPRASPFLTHWTSVNMSSKPPETPKRSKAQQEAHVLDIIRSIPSKKDRAAMKDEAGSSTDGQILSKKEQAAERKKEYYRA